MTVMAGCTVCLLWRRLYFLIALFTADFFLQQSTISFSSKFELYKSLVTSVLLFGCETWTLLANSEKKMQTFETKCLKKLLRISHLEHDQRLGAEQNQPHRNLFWHCPETETNLHGSGKSLATTASPKPPFRAPKRVGDAVVGRGNAEWTTWKSGRPCRELLTKACCRKDRKRISAESSLMPAPPPRQPNRSRHRTELNPVFAAK